MLEQQGLAYKVPIYRAIRKICLTQVKKVSLELPKELAPG
jgi:hypothetical protein